MTVRCELSVVLLATAVAAVASTIVPSHRSAASPPAAPWVIDSTNSSLIFRVKNRSTTFFYGRFNDIGGQIVWDDADAARCSFHVEIQTVSVDTKSEKRDGHLRSPDFFNAGQFPVCTFMSTSVRPAGDAFEMAGDLTINGRTNPIIVRLEKTGQTMNQRGEIIGFETVFTVDRSEFGMHSMPDALGQEVKIFVSLEGKRP